VAREVAELIRRDLAARRLSVDLLLAENLPPVRGDRVQLQQVLLNLLSNGADAIEAAGGGRRQLEIRTALVAPATVLVSVQDSGIGLSPEDAERGFEQFYTPKPRGLGIGLSICRSIVTAHGGHLSASAADGSGAVFRFSLPVAADSSIEVASLPELIVAGEKSGLLRP